MQATYSVLECVNVEVRSQSVVTGLLLQMIDQCQHVERKHTAVRSTFISHPVVQHTPQRQCTP